MQNRILIVAVAAVALFLAGFVPQYVRANRLDRELRQAQLASAYGEVRDLSALAYVQANQKNYGLAAETTARFFNRVRETVNQTQDENERKALESLIANRDKITAGLAKGDAATISDIEELFLKSRQVTASGTR
jgi:hypothetical protein